MGESYRELLDRLARVEPDINLQNKILAIIQLEQKRQVRLKAWGFSAGATTALGTVVASGIYLYKVAIQSGFHEYLSLAFSGDGAVYVYWKELLLSLVESAPLLGIIALLTALTFFIWSGANAITNTRRSTLIATA